MRISQLQWIDAEYVGVMADGDWLYELAPCGCKIAVHKPTLNRAPIVSFSACADHEGKYETV